MDDLNTYMYVPYWYLINSASSKKKKNWPHNEYTTEIYQDAQPKIPKNSYKFMGKLNLLNLRLHLFSNGIFMHAKISY